MNNIFYVEQLMQKTTIGCNQQDSGYGKLCRTKWFGFSTNNIARWIGKMKRNFRSNKSLKKHNNKLQHTELTSISECWPKETFKMTLMGQLEMWTLPIIFWLVTVVTRLFIFVNTQRTLYLVEWIFLYVNFLKL